MFVLPNATRPFINHPMMPSKVTLDIRLRPLRLAILIRPGNLKDLRTAIELSTCTWGGKYNIILPNYRRTPGGWERGRRRQRPWREIVSGYLDVFEPDAMVWIGGPPPKWLLDTGIRVLRHDEVFGEHGDLGVSFGISAFHVYRSLYDRNYRFVQRHPRPAIYGQSSELPLLASAACGAFPSEDHHRYRENYIDALEGSEEPLTPERVVDVLVHGLTPLKATSFEVRP